MSWSSLVQQWVARVVDRAGTQTAAADALGITQGMVSKIYNDPDYTPDLETVEKMARKQGFGGLSEFFRHVEGQTPIDADSAGRKMTASRGGPVLSAAGDDESEILRTFAWACLRAADSAERLTMQSILEELAVSFTRAANPTDSGAVDEARRNVRTIRERRKERAG